MEHEMRLAVLPRDSGPMVVPYCIGCGWVGRRRNSPDSLQSVAGEWRTHVKEFDESQDMRTVEEMWAAYRGLAEWFLNHGRSE